MDPVIETSSRSSKKFIVLNVLYSSYRDYNRVNYIILLEFNIFYLSLMLMFKYLKTTAAVIGFSPLKLRAGSECRTESAKLAKTKAQKNVK